MSVAERKAVTDHDRADMALRIFAMRGLGLGRLAKALATDLRTIHKILDSGIRESDPAYRRILPNLEALESAFLATQGSSAATVATVKIDLENHREQLRRRREENAARWVADKKAFDAGVCATFDARDAAAKPRGK